MRLIGLFLIFSTILTKTVLGQNFTTTNLHCEYLSNPEGIDVIKPRFSWKLKENEQKRGLQQSAYSILVASSIEKLHQNEGDIWESGKVNTDQSVHIEYDGLELQSKKRYFWKVKIWNDDGKVSSWSNPHHWSMGLLEANDWKAKWIGLEKAPTLSDSTAFKLAAKYFRKEFMASSSIKSAKAYISGLGLFEFYINGNKVSSHIFSPGFTHYSKEIPYLTYDITNQLKRGNNAIGVIVGNGRYHMPNRPRLSIGKPKMICQIEIEYTDGRYETIISDSSWKVSINGPIVNNSEYDGETYDSRKEIRNWNLPNFDESAWNKVEEVTTPTQKMSAFMIDPSRIIETISPTNIWKSDSGRYIVDFSQNFSGWVEIRVKESPNSEIKIRHAELLKADSNINIKNIRSAKATDKYICHSNNEEIYEPRFTQHGFRYVEITGLSKRPDKSSIIAKVVHDDLAPVGHLETSINRINTILDMTKWTMRSNYHSIPFDCPQRDERQGWLGDRGQVTDGESYLYDVSKFYTKWLRDIQNTQKKDGQLPNVAPKSWAVFYDNVTWPMTYLDICHMMYTRYEDRRIVKQHYTSMKKWMQYMQDKYMEDRNIISIDVYGDWSAPSKNSNNGNFKANEKLQTRAEILASTYFYHGLQLMIKFAKISGNNQDITVFERSASKIKAALQKEYIDTSTLNYGNLTPTEIILLLAFDIPTTKQAKQLIANLEGLLQGHHHGNLASGVIGLKWLLRTLSKNGLNNVAYQLVTNSDYPSWGHMIDNNATTFWETWNGFVKDSHNHLMLAGDLPVWLFENIAGIKPKNGYKYFILKPTFFKDLQFVNAKHTTSYGEISSNWKLGNATLEWNVNIPPNTKALIYIPAKKQSQIYENNNNINNAVGIKYVSKIGNCFVYEVLSGSYAFSVRNIQLIANSKTIESPRILPNDSTFSHNNAITVAMQHRSDQAQIRYTTDGSTPSSNSTLFAQPFQIQPEGFMEIKAIAIQNNLSSYMEQIALDRFDSTVNGWNYEYFEGQWQAVPDYNKEKAIKSGKIQQFDLEKIKMRPHYWGTRFKAAIDLPRSGKYTFYLTSNDGGIVKLDGKIVTNNDGCHYSIQKSGSTYLEKGRHNIEISHFNYYSYNSLSLLFSGPGFSKQKVPLSMIFYK